MTPRSTHLPRRRLLLGSTGAVALTLLAAGCGDGDTTATISPDQAALNTALVGEQTLIVAFEPGVAGTDAEQRRGAAALRSHRAHAEALIAAGASEASGADATTGSDSATPAPTPTTPASARELARLQRAQVDRLERLALGVSPRVALLLGSIGASDAATAALLGTGR